jgi:hypothetical protein
MKKMRVRFLSQDAVEVLINILLSPRESIAPSHEEIMAPQTIPFYCAQLG